MKTLTTYDALTEILDRRKSKYKQLEKQLDYLVAQYGKESIEVYNFLNSPFLPVSSRE